MPLLTLGFFCLRMSPPSLLLQSGIHKHSTFSGTLIALSFYF
jgi:hypothetical protein